MTEALVSSNHRKPNLRHFYAYKKDGVFQSGLKVDYVRLTNTVMAPREETELDEDIKLIRTGAAKCKELFYLDTRNFTSLTLRIALSLALILSTSASIAAFLSGQVPGKAGLGNNVFLIFLMFYALNFFQSLMACGFLIFILTWIMKQIYLLVGITRFKVFNTIFNITFLLMFVLSFLMLYVLLQNPAFKNNVFGMIIGILIWSILLPALTTFLSSINIKNHRRLKIETEWRVNGRVYGEHLNQDNIPVLYPKRARDFYPLSPMEYKTLVAYQTAQGDRKQVKQLLKVWRTKAVVVAEDARLFARQNSNLLRKLGIFLFRITVSLLALFLEILGKTTKNKLLNVSAQGLKIKGINRTFWIYQECEAALKRLVAMQ
ncbi:hypothetical protein [Allocoleopsis sp.]|uniref:hypothetical protein n=1 Tax=Allocoleopsis sp. TaxID=3088169 RepID=UPI002FCFA2E0